VRARFAAAGRPSLLLWREQAVRSKIEADRAETLRKVLPSLLTPAQVRRLRQVELQALGLGVFADPEVQTALALTDEQRAAIRAIAQEREDLSLSQPGEVVGILDYVLLARRIPRVLKVLSEDQRQAWANLTGEPFKVPLQNSDLLVQIRQDYMAPLMTPGERPAIFAPVGGDPPRP
jgi:hypothetical protein